MCIRDRYLFIIIFLTSCSKNLIMVAKPKGLVRGKIVQSREATKYDKGVMKTANTDKIADILFLSYYNLNKFIVTHAVVC